MKNSIAVSALALFCTVAVAQPTSIFGFALGKPLDLSDCPFQLSPVSKTKLYDATTPTTCVQDAHSLRGHGQPVREINFSQADAPKIVKYYRAYPLEQDGIFIGLYFLTPGLDAQDFALDQLTKKYGAPTVLNKSVVQNAMGATFESINAAWKLGVVNVTFIGMSGQTDYGEVYIDLPEATQLRASWIEKASAKERNL